MQIPSSTYRVQLHKGFTFRDLQRIVPYLHTMGVTTLYASPIMQATPGSMHGYDVTDPHTLNAELGTLDELKTVIRELHKKDMNWLQDIVPNHMAYHPDNYRLMDVLERGPHSPYYQYFDIDWNHPSPDLAGKVMVPFLGSEPAACLSNGEIKLAFGAQGFRLKYFDTPYPLSLSAYAVMQSLLEETKEKVSPVLTRMTAAGEGADYETWKTSRLEFIEAVRQDTTLLAGIERELETLNQNPAALMRIMDAQYYRLAYWKETDKRINYRRFFTVNELICLRMEDEKVFGEYHTYLSKLFRDKLMMGFRIDHIDGLRDPGRYTRDLRELLGDGCYIIAEKILEAQEEMPGHWPLQGTSGYEFLSFLNQLLTHRKGAKELLAFYQELVPGMPPYKKLIFESKQLILEKYLAGEWENLTQLFFSLDLGADYDRPRIKQAMGLFMLCLPVYRIYPDAMPLKGQSLVIVHEAFDKALGQGAGYEAELKYLQQLFTQSPPSDETGERTLQFLQRLMQFTGPLTAKGVEDTTFYIYNPLISHDEVGDSPSALGMSVQRFHEKMQARLASTPLSLNATATHDTKRGEDARIRINVLSRIPGAWREHVLRWMKINAPYRTVMDGRTIPGVNDEYFIYQSMLGGFPEDFSVTEDWIERVQAYLNKALREAKVHSNWSDPDEQYENGCAEFVRRILHPDHRFLESFVPFVKTVCEHAMVYSLSQTLIKLTAPGIPDVYQGCELWDLSFVDPDNRRPVNYEKRMEFLFQLVIKEEKGKQAVMEYLKENREAGAEKLFITWKTLNFRRLNPALFTEGSYIPLVVTGKEISAAAYARNKKDAWALVIFPLGMAKHEMEVPDPASPGNIEQFVILPEKAPQRWTHVFTGETFEDVNQIRLDELFRNFPVALLLPASAPGNKPSSSSPEKFMAS